MLAPTVRCISLFCLAGCVGYQAADATPSTVAAEVAVRRGGTFTVDQAIDTALRQNPRITALEARLRAADAETSVPLLVLGEWRGRAEAFGVMLDPVAWLGLGSRGGAIGFAEAQRGEAAAQLAVAAWETAVAVAETYLVDSALRELQVPDLSLDIEGFAASGLASPVAAQQLRAATARATSERTELAAARRNNEAQLRHLLGLPDGADVTLAPLPTDWLTQPMGTEDLLLGRPDLTLATARFEVADAGFRQAVADQYPSFDIGPNISLIGGPLRTMGMLRVPFNMQGRAEAAREGRMATHRELEEAYLRAAEEATGRDAQLDAAQALVSATQAAVAASDAAFTAARVAIEVEVDAFGMFVQAAGAVMRDTMEHRRAALALARAQIQRAAAYGWPRQGDPSAEGETP